MKKASKPQRPDRGPNKSAPTADAEPRRCVSAIYGHVSHGTAHAFLKVSYLRIQHDFDELGTIH